MSKLDQTPSQAKASSSEAQAGAEQTKAKQSPPLPQTQAFLMLVSYLNSTPRQRIMMSMVSNLKVLIKLVKAMRGIKKAVLLNSRTMIIKRKNS